MPLTLTRVEQLKDFQETFQIEFKNIELLDQALTHCSCPSADIAAADNERLEFLGDAVLKLVVSEHLFQTFPDRDEGFLTKVRAVLVSDSMLAEIGGRYTLGKYLLMSRNEEGNGGALRKSNLADGMEAVFAAYYLDSGLESVRELIIRIYQPIFAEEFEIGDYQDYKSVLQEKVQAVGWKLPEYHVIQEAGPEHNKLFTSQVRVGKGIKKYREAGQGRTKKESEQRAAQKLLELLEAESVCI
ncbi:ribonuclease III [Candidatus Termititenax spirochaetophilus]|uniref:Ribonuclease 3 n=1 Tax=Candidatus Termititenax spirochaetophilus TaxID=2218522 RepID=A0A388T8K3_9BACT|nr:ribonuclease III [Candidatus Termititenax spirochaetophilus]